MREETVPQGNLTLGSAQFDRVLDVLVAEQATLRHHLRWYRLQRLASHLLATAFAVGLAGAIVSVRTESDTLPTCLIIGAEILGAVSCLAIVPLFFINLPFAWKLLRQERPRRRLGVQEGLRDRFKRVVKRRWILLALSAGGLVAAVGACLFLAQEVEVHGDTRISEIVEALWGQVFVIVVGLSMPSSWLVSRGVDRLEEVSRIQERLASEVGPHERDSGQFEVPVRDHDRVARLEKLRVLDDRHRSVRQGAKLAKASICAIQRSLEAQAMIEGLDPKVRLRLEETIYGLIAKPRSKAARVAASGRLSLAVPGSPLVLSYEVDDDDQCIRIHAVRAAGVAT